jgi:trans-aconitate methyltransferase
MRCIVLATASGHVLELGAGTGDLTWRLAETVASIDAVEPSRPMIATALARSAAVGRGNVRWFAETAESFAPERRYALAVAAESLHWMDWSRVLPTIARALLPHGTLAIVADRVWVDLPWNDALREIIARHSTNQHYRTTDIIHELSQRGLFLEQGRRSFRQSFSQRVHDYVRSFHSRNGFSLERMSEQAATAFDHAVELLVTQHCPDGQIAGTVKSTLVWGLPRDEQAAGGSSG